MKNSIEEGIRFKGCFLSLSIQEIYDGKVDLCKWR